MDLLPCGRTTRTFLISRSNSGVLLIGRTPGVVSVGAAGPPARPCRAGSPGWGRRPAPGRRRGRCGRRAHRGEGFAVVDGAASAQVSSSRPTLKALRKRGRRRRARRRRSPRGAPAPSGLLARRADAEIRPPTTTSPRRTSPRIGSDALQAMARHLLDAELHRVAGGELRRCRRRRRERQALTRDLPRIADAPASADARQYRASRDRPGPWRAHAALEVARGARESRLRRAGSRAVAGAGAAGSWQHFAPASVRCRACLRARRPRVASSWPVPRGAARARFAAFQNARPPRAGRRACAGAGADVGEVDRRLTRSRPAFAGLCGAATCGASVPRSNRWRGARSRRRRCPSASSRWPRRTRPASTSSRRAHEPRLPAELGGHVGKGSCVRSSTAPDRVAAVFDSLVWPPSMP